MPIHTLNNLIGSLSLLLMQNLFTRNMSNMWENEKCGRGKRHAASDKQQRKIVISTFGQISTISENVVQPVAAGLYSSHEHRFL